MPKFEDIFVGQKAVKTTLISKEMIARFAEVTLDDNPVHLDETYAAGNSFFKRCVAHGMISASLAASLMGTELPGHGTIYLGQSLKFKNPVFPGDEVTVRLEVLEKQEVSKRIRLSTVVVNQDGKVVVEGEATVMLRLP
ncbi:MAG: MaoC family dehydratase [Deltaproteobacteria bacterium]|jgi:3-hydroxybutyryl-CoA dehydratase|nr:MaoC family dehydratase [Deltaproteobacteria bacterium]